MTTIRLDDYTYPLCSDCDHEGCTTTKSLLTVSRKAAGMKTYVFSDEHNCDHTYVLAADAQRALDAEREKAKELEKMYRFSITERNKLNAETDELALEIDSKDSQLATLQAQLAQLATFITVHVPGEPSPTQGSLGAVDCAIHIIINLQAQLRQVEWASVPRSRYDALNKDWLEEKESARRLKEVLAQLCLEMECSRNSMFVQMAVNVRATLLSAAGKQMEVK